MREEELVCQRIVGTVIRVCEELDAIEARGEGGGGEVVPDLKIALVCSART